MHEVYFTNGLLTRIEGIPKSDYYERRDIAYDAKVIYSDGMRHDMRDAESIKGIRIPNFRLAGESSTATFWLDYILRMIAGHIREEGDHYLSIICLVKATQLMESSDMLWQYKDYWRLCEWLYQDGRIEQGDAFDEYFTKKYVSPNCRLKAFQYTISHCKDLGTDLVQVKAHTFMCSICAKHSNRYYSISGRDIRFPKLPKVFWKYGGFHDGCRCEVHPVFYPASKPTLTNGDNYISPKDIIKYSHRPRLDRRTDDEIRAYNGFLKRREMAQQYFVDRRAYFVLKNRFPTYAPKSFAAFRRLEDNDPAEYKRLIRLCAKESDI